MSDSRPSVELVSLAEDLTVSDKTMNFGGKEMSVIDYIKSDDKYSQEAFDAIDPDEPLARVRFPWSDDPVDTAPSLLHPSTSQWNRTEDDRICGTISRRTMARY